MKKPIRFPFRHPSGLIRSESGVSAIEFALILPLMLAFYVGTVEVSRGLSVSRNVTNVASTVGDLISQQKGITATELTNISKAAEAIVSPLATASMKIHISSYCMNSSNVIKKDWVHKYNSGATSITTASSEITDLITKPGESLIVAEVEYTYTYIAHANKVFDFLTPGNTAFSGTGKTITDTFFLRPRNVAYITKSGDTNDCT